MSRGTIFQNNVAVYLHLFVSFINYTFYLPFIYNIIIYHLHISYITYKLHLFLTCYNHPLHTTLIIYICHTHITSIYITIFNYMWFNILSINHAIGKNYYTGTLSNICQGVGGKSDQGESKVCKFTDAILEHFLSVIFVDM